MSDGWAPIHFERTSGTTPLVLICEHASPLLPPDFGNLGLEEAAQRSHAAWDPGALEVARHLSEALDAPLAYGGLSRLLYDCNRPPDAQDAIPARSEVIEVPGNAGLTTAERHRRVRLIHDPFHAGVASLIDTQIHRCGQRPIVVTIHSFTPVYFGARREVELGFLHHKKAELSVAAEKLEKARGTYRAALNEPYGAKDGVTYTLKRHGDDRGLPNTMIEIRNDLIATPEEARTVALHLAETLRRAMAEVSGPVESRT